MPDIIHNNTSSIENLRKFTTQQDQNPQEFVPSHSPFRLPLRLRSGLRLIQGRFCAGTSFTYPYLYQINYLPVKGKNQHFEGFSYCLPNPPKSMADFSLCLCVFRGLIRVCELCVCPEPALGPFGCAQGKLRRRGERAGICGFMVSVFRETK